MKSCFRILAVACIAMQVASLAAAGIPEEKAADPAEYSVIRVPVSSEQVWILRGGNGEEMYAEFCAECHGAGGTGNPIAVAALGKPIPSLVELTDTGRPGEFARAYVQHVLDSPCDSGYHRTSSGTLTMPCWRRIIRHALESDSPLDSRRRTATVTATLANHIESLQSQK